MARLLIDRGGDVNSTDDHGRQPIHLVRSEAMAATLIAAGADVNAPGEFRKRPLHVARNVPIARLLLTRGAGLDDQVGYSRTSPLLCAAEDDRFDVAKLLADRGAAIELADRYQKTPLHFACRNGNLALVKLLIDRGADIGATTDKGHTPIWIAAGGDLWYNPIEREHGAIVAFLVQHGASPKIQDQFGKTLLHLAAECGRLDVAQRLIDLGLDVNGRTNDGSTPLPYAARVVEGGWRFHSDGTREVALVRLLVAHGADVNAVARRKGGHPVTPLALASRRVELQPVQLAGIPGESEEMKRNVDRTNLVKQAIVAILRSHGAK